MTDSTVWLRLALLVLVGVQAGRFVDQWFILSFSFRALDAPKLSEAVRSLGAAIKVSMLVTAAAVAVLFAAVLLTEPELQSPRGKLTLLGLGFFLAVVALTVVQELPLVMRIEALGTAPPPPDWQALRTRWLAAHTARAVIALCLFVTVALAFR